MLFGPFTPSELFGYLNGLESSHNLEKKLGQAKSQALWWL